jgi:hypothetical protein
VAGELPLRCLGPDAPPIAIRTEIVELVTE